MIGFIQKFARQVVPETTIARVAAVALMAVVSLFQFATIAQVHLADRQFQINSLVKDEIRRVDSALQYTTPESLQNQSEDLLAKQLRGLKITASDNSVLAELGDAPDETLLPHILKREAGDWALYVDDYADLHWQIQSAAGAMTGVLRVDVAPGIISARNSTIFRATITLVLMLVAGLVVSWLINRLVNHYFVDPTNVLVGHIESWQDHTDDTVGPEEACADAPHLLPLANTFQSLIEQQRQASRQVRVKQKYLEFAAHHDPLTHLPNRLMFEDTLAQTVTSALEEGTRFIVYLVDLDNFKILNDQYGHVVGDRMVAEMGTRLQSMMGDNDLVARLDGDEFAVIQPKVANRASAELVAERLMMAARRPFEYRGFTIKTTVTIGISFHPQGPEGESVAAVTSDEMINNASVALQEAKTNGKNQYQFFNESMRSRLTAQIQLERDLRTALEDEQFEVWYQPKINIRTRKVIGAEALVRWKHPTKGFISPELFVPVAEEAGLIIELGEWILRTACQQTQDLQEMGYEGIGVAVNISAVQFTDGNLLPMVNGAIQDSSLNPQLLELEITESAVMHDPEDVIKSLHELSQFGMRLAIDDFGTGYSSLAYLKRFPVDTLKIDRAFITDVSSDNDDVAIVEAVLGLGKHFNMKVVAEGVEDEDQLQFLKTQGCDIAQGYYISRPMGFDDYLAWMRDYAPGFQNILSAFNDDESDSDPDAHLDSVVNQ